MNESAGPPPAGTILEPRQRPTGGPVAAPTAGDTQVEELVQRRAQLVRKPPPAKFGAIDVGTNSIHLMMVEITPEGDFQILGRDKEMVRLGQDGFVQHRLTERAMNDGVAALTRFVKLARLKGITRVRAVATSAVREARNGGDFVQRVRDELGIELHVVSPEEEARLIYEAVRHAVDLGEADNLIVDIGGGSVEVIVGNASRAELCWSMKLGSSRLTELFLRSDPPALAELKAMRRHIRRQFEPLAKAVGARRLARCIGTSGTIQNLATLCAFRRGTKEIEPNMQLRVERGDLKGVLSDLTGMSRERRVKVPGMDERRQDTVLPGAMLLSALMRMFDIDACEYCDLALREGIILDHIQKQRAHLLARAMWPDPRLRSVVQLAQRCGYRQAHAEQVARLALDLFDQLATLHGLPEACRDLLRYACLLHDVGYLISHRGHHKHSYYLIRNGGLQGFSEREIEVIANLARYHRKGRPRKSHYSYKGLDAEDRPVVRKLIPLVRLANALDRTHYSVIESVVCSIMAEAIEVRVRSKHDVELELWTAQRQNEAFEREYGLPIRIELIAAEPEAAESEQDAGTTNDE